MENDARRAKAKSFEGVWAALATPFDTEGKLCLKSFDKLLDRQVAAGVDGFVPLGTTGESPTLSTEERRLILAACLQKAKKHGKKVIAGCGSNDTAKAVALTQEAAEAGCDGALIITPYYNKPTQEGLAQHFLKIADETSLPIVLYHSQPRTSVALVTETFQRLFEHPRIVGVKEASGNHAVWLSLAEEYRKTGKTLLAGDDDMMASFGAMGASGVISASCNVLPKGFVQIWRHLKAGELQQAFETQLEILPLVRAMFCETNPMPVKYALHKLGVCENILRLPMVPVRPASEKIIDRALELMASKDLL